MLESFLACLRAGRVGSPSSVGSHNMSDIKALEYPTLKVPYEILNKQFRATQKNIDREVSHVTNATADLEKGIASGEANVGEIKLLLGTVVEKLNILKRKVSDSGGDYVGGLCGGNL